VKIPKKDEKVFVAGKAAKDDVSILKKHRVNISRLIYEAIKTTAESIEKPKK